MIRFINIVNVANIIAHTRSVGISLALMESTILRPIPGIAKSFSITTDAPRRFANTDPLIVIIGRSAFHFCSGLIKVVIPDSVISLGEGAFDGCIRLKSVVFENTENWKVDGTVIDSAQLSDHAKAAEFLTSTYCYKSWTRE